MYFGSQVKAHSKLFPSGKNMAVGVLYGSLQEEITINTHTHIYLYKNAHVCTHIQTYAHIHKNMHTNTHVYTKHMHIYTHIQTHILQTYA